MITPAQLKEVFQSFPDNCLLLKPDAPRFTIAKVNRAFEESFLLTSEQLLGNSFLEALDSRTGDKAYIDTLSDALEKTLELGKPHHIPELRYDITDPKTGILIERFWEVDNIPVNNAIGETEFILHRVRDITHIIRTKEKEIASLRRLKKSERVLEQTQEIAKIGSWELDLEKNTLFWSGTLKKIHEVPQNFIPSLETAIDFYKTDKDKSTIREVIANAIKTGGGFDLELEIVTANRNEKWIRATGKAEFKNGKCIRVFGATQDITTRKLAEIRLENINDNIPGVVFRYKLKPNGEDQLMYISEGARDVWGIAPEEAASNNARVWEIYYEEDVEAHNESIRNSARNLCLWTNEWRIKHPEKGIRWNRGFGSPQKGSDGSIIWDAIILDVTEEKLAYELLELNEARQRGLLESQTNYVIRTDIEGNYTYYNNKFEEDFGWIHQREGLIGETCMIAVIEKDRSKVEETAFKCLENPDETFQIEIGKPKRDGEVRTTVWDFTALSDAEGNPTEIQCIGIDISEKKEAELALNKIKEQYEVLIESIEGVFWELNVETFEFTFVSEQASILLGIKPKDWYNKPKFWENHIHPEDRAYAINFCMSQVEKGKNHSFEYRMQRADGSYIWISDMVSVVKENGKPRWLRGIMTDISKRKHTEEQLQLSEQRFKGLVQEGGDLIALLDESGDYMYASPTSISVLGYTPEDFKNRNAFEFIHPRDIGKVQKKFEEISRQKRVQISAFRFKHKNGGWRWLETTVTNLLDDPAVKGIVSNARDITDKKRFQELENLERKVLEMNFKKDSRLTKILNFYVENLENINPNAYFIIHKLEHEKLYKWAAGALPENLTKLLEGHALQEKDNACFFFHQKEHKILKIDTADNSELKSIAIKNEIDSCYSYPIVDSKSQRLGVFTVFYKSDPFSEEKQEQRGIKRSVGLLQLIIEFQLNELALKRSNQRYEFVNKATEDAIYDWDVVNNELKWGDGFYKMLDLDRENGKFPLEKWSERIHHDNINEVNKSLEKSLEDKSKNKWSSEYLFRKNNGTYLDIIENGYIIRNDTGEPLRMIGVLRDITDLKAYEKELKSANERYRYVTKATSDAIWDYDIEQGTVFWGGGFETLFGYNLEKIKPDLSPRYENIHPDDLRRTIKSFLDVIESGDTIWEEEYKYRNVHGEYLDIFDRGFVVRDKKGKAVRMVGAMQDISRKKQYEISLTKLNEDLKKRAKELVISNAELEQFAYVASHDLQEPLRMVTSFLTQLEKKYAEVLDEKALLYIDFAVDGAKRMRQIILDLLEFSRVGRTEDKLEELALNEILEEIKHLYRKRIEERNVRIISGNLPVIKAPKSPIRQVFQNLISNAIKYSKEDVHPEIAIEFKEIQDFWEFSIKDNGIGIAEEYFDRIFVIFQRLHRREEYSGTGMGLAVTKKIIENLGGKIWLESLEGEGSTFHFTISKNIAKL
ncbi:PAS domain S-box-containing protein [Salegentibacter sp. 24]|jgi:PAS domain S-box-containing protein|uniref:PAS domain-containing protein n=1 Tax=Salegentibacter sp. 24 TaxID=2183986 RepID=UPI00105F01DB|nr:PAS domain-containing protein [Salegentibacter sp. 24]TDN85874.1 PAS domain S-box-containing protein [Salegentibacter sp. 24]